MKLGGGGGRRNLLSDGPKFFNRSSITLKFGGAQKLERESQERERERERERGRASCYFFYARKLLFYSSKLLFYTLKLSFLRS